MKITKAGMSLVLNVSSSLSSKGMLLQIKIAIYDWDIVWKSTELGSTILEIDEEGRTEAVWHSLDSASGQVSIQFHRHTTYSKGSTNV